MIERRSKFQEDSSEVSPNRLTMTKKVLTVSDKRAGRPRQLGYLITSRDGPLINFHDMMASSRRAFQWPEKTAAQR